MDNIWWKAHQTPYVTTTWITRDGKRAGWRWEDFPRTLTIDLAHHRSRFNGGIKQKRWSWFPRIRTVDCRTIQKFRCWTKRSQAEGHRFADNHLKPHLWMTREESPFVNDWKRELKLYMLLDISGCGEAWSPTPVGECVMLKLSITYGWHVSVTTDWFCRKS